ncbi:MAG: hypothetical protein AB7E46_09890 [Desulfovibrio sp.]|jgi:hypothetical protein
MTEQLRPWAAAGLSHLFLPEGLQDAIVPPDPNPAHACAQASGENPPPVHAGSEPLEAPHADPAAPVWPEPWLTLAARVRTPPRVIITYASLADDVSGSADPVRRKLLQTVLAFLAWPQGTSLFWPISFPSGVDPGPVFASDYFAAGVRHFNIRHVVCFGDAPARRAKTLFPQDDTAVLIHAAPSPEELTGLLPHELHQALAHLKAIALG